MSLLVAVETILIFPVLFIERFIAPSASVVRASSAYVSSTAFHECRPFGLRCPLHNFIDVLVKEVQNLLEVLGVSFVPVDEVILQFRLQISMLGADLPQ